MDINSILLELGKQMGLENLKLDQNRVCRLVFDKKYIVDIEATEDEKIVHIYSTIAPIPPENKEQFYELFLEANLFGKGTGGATFGINKMESELMFTRAIAMDTCDYQEFVNILENFVNHVESWMTSIENGSAFQDKVGSSPAKGSSSESSSSGFDESHQGFIKA